MTSGRSNGNGRSTHTGRMAALHAHGSAVRAVVAEPAGDGFTVVEARSFDAEASSQLRPWLTRHRAETVVGVVPAAASVCRCLPLPESGADDRQRLADALSLLAEAELSPTLADHRRAAGVIRLNGAAPAALVQGWPAAGAERAALPDGVEPDGWITEAGALAMLAGMTENSTLCARAHAQSGSLTAIATGVRGTVCRVMRIGGEVEDSFRHEAEEAIAETAAAAGLDQPPPGLAQSPGCLLFNGSPPGKVGGTRHDGAWLEQFGLACGAIAAAASSDPAVRSLASLHRMPPDAHRSRLERTLEWLGEPRHAAAVVAACLVLLLLLPVGVAYGRYRLLSAASGGPAALADRLESARREVEFYRLLHAERWPMTKLLADVTSCAPEGIQLEVMDISRSGGLTVRGTAKRTELITQFRENLARTRVFTQIEVPTRAEGAADVDFQLSANVERPLYAQVIVDDFTKRTLFQRKYGDDAVPSATAAVEPDASPSSQRTAERSSGRFGREPGSRTTAGQPPPNRSQRDKPIEPIPDPLTDAQIASMDRATAMKEWTSRLLAATKTDDPAVKQRLDEEAKKCKARMDALKGAS